MCLRSSIRLDRSRPKLEQVAVWPRIWTEQFTEHHSPYAILKQVPGFPADIVHKYRHQLIVASAIWPAETIQASDKIMRRSKDGTLLEAEWIGHPRQEHDLETAGTSRWLYLAWDDPQILKPGVIS